MVVTGFVVLWKLKINVLITLGRYDTYLYFSLLVLQENMRNGRASQKSSFCKVFHDKNFINS